MEKFTPNDGDYMRRALDLAIQGYGNVSPNPMVGAVIVADGRIIGEGFHRKYGEAHAERNAVASVREEDRYLLPESTMYVTLEPCTHFGKTPPCADLVIECGIKRVVVSSLDPFLDSERKGVDVLRKAGVSVETGLLREESEFMNRKFLTSHTSGRPYVTLKWAQTSDGYMGSENDERLLISNPLSEVLMHRVRAGYDAIMTGTDTVRRDNPALTCRLWPTRDSEARPLKVSFDSDRLPRDSKILQGKHVLMKKEETIEEFLKRLYEEEKVTSLLVEGGAKTLRKFFENGFADEIRIETSPLKIGKGVKAPDVADFLKKNDFKLIEDTKCRDNQIRTYIRNS